MLVDGQFAARKLLLLPALEPQPVMDRRGRTAELLHELRYREPGVRQVHDLLSKPQGVANYSLVLEVDILDPPVGHPEGSTEQGQPDASLRVRLAS
jgi:hypothetical protein